jgi:hypothetical protein
MAITLPQDVLEIIFGVLEAEVTARRIPQHLDVWLDLGTQANGGSAAVFADSTVDPH